MAALTQFPSLSPKINWEVIKMEKKQHKKAKCPKCPNDIEKGRPQGLSGPPSIKNILKSRVERYVRKAKKQKKLGPIEKEYKEELRIAQARSKRKLKVFEEEDKKGSGIPKKEYKQKLKTIEKEYEKELEAVEEKYKDLKISSNIEVCTHCGGSGSDGVPDPVTVKNPTEKAFFTNLIDIVIHQGERKLRF